MNDLVTKSQGDASALRFLAAVLGAVTLVVSLGAVVLGALLLGANIAGGLALIGGGALGGAWAFFVWFAGRAVADNLEVLARLLIEVRGLRSHHERKGKHHHRGTESAEGHGDEGENSGG